MTKKKDNYWQGKWKKGTRVSVTNGDWTIGKGTIVKIMKDKNWAVVKLDKKPEDYMGYSIKNKPGYVKAYKGYTYRYK